MTKSQLVDQLTEGGQRSKSETEQIVDLVFAGISKALQQGEGLDVRGFGSFKLRDQKARQGRNPRTGEALLIPAKRVVVFKPSKQLSAQLNGAEAAAADAST